MLYILAVLVIVILTYNLVYNYLSGKRLFQDAFHLLFLKNKSLSKLDMIWEDSSNKSDINISLTTIPERIEMLEMTLKSLLSQQVLPNKIYLFVPYLSFRNGTQVNIPEFLNRLKSVEVVRTSVDYGPSTKFIAAVEKFQSGTKILVVDDDNMYPPNYIKEFSENYKSHKDIIIGASGWVVPSDFTHRPTTLLRNICKTPPYGIPGTRIKEKIMVDIVEGYSGFLIKPEFFNAEELKNYEGAPPAARFVDDIWVSAHSKVPKAILPLSRFCYVPYFLRPIYYQSSLGKINNEGKSPSERNNSIMMNYFKDKWLVSKT